MNAERLTFLRELKAFGEQEDIPNVSEQNARFLHFLVQSKRAKSVLEIGTANGYSTIWLADAVEPLGGKVITYDFSAPQHAMAIENMKLAGVDERVELNFGNALKFLPDLNETFDVIFVDGQKATYLELWHAIQHLIGDNTLVIFDDVLKFAQKTKPFTDHVESQTEFGWVVVPTDEDDGIMLLQKKLD